MKCYKKYSCLRLSDKRWRSFCLEIAAHLGGLWWQAPGATLSFNPVA